MYICALAFLECKVVFLLQLRWFLYKLVLLMHLNLDFIVYSRKFVKIPPHMGSGVSSSLGHPHSRKINIEWLSLKNRLLWLYPSCPIPFYFDMGTDPRHLRLPPRALLHGL